MFTTDPRAKLSMASRRLSSGWMGLGIPRALSDFLRQAAGGRNLALSVLGCALVTSGHCQVYVGAAASGGSIVLSNFPSQEAPVLLLPGESSGIAPVLVKLRTADPASPRLPRKSDHLQGVIESVALRVDIPSQLIHAVISAESNYNVKALSPKGAMGLMQLMPATAKRFGVTDPFVVEDNVFAGARYLKWLLGYFEGDLELVLAAYNAGEQAVVRAGRKVPKYPETQAYVRRIMADLRSSQALSH